MRLIDKQVHRRASFLKTTAFPRLSRYWVSKKWTRLLGYTHVQCGMLKEFIKYIEQKCLSKRKEMLRDAAKK